MTEHALDQRSGRVRNVSLYATAEFNTANFQLFLCARGSVCDTILELLPDAEYCEGAESRRHPLSFRYAFVILHDFLPLTVQPRNSTARNVSQGTLIHCLVVMHVRQARISKHSSIRHMFFTGKPLGLRTASKLTKTQSTRRRTEVSLRQCCARCSLGCRKN